MLFARTLLTLLLLLPLLRPACAQDTAPGDFRFEHLTVDQGLSHSDAMAIAQDRAGFIWVGTNHGLNRYDGYELKQYWLPINRSGTSGNRIKVLHTDPSGHLWVGTERSGLSLYNPGTDQLASLAEPPGVAKYAPQLRFLNTQSIAALATDAQGHLWVGTVQAGLFVLTLNPQGQLTALRAVPLAGAPAGGSYVSSLAADAEGNVWVGTFNYGLHIVRPEARQAERTALTDAVRALHLDRRGDLWIGTDYQVLWVSAANRRTVRELGAHPQAITYPQLQTIRLDSFGRLWVGTIYGLYVWEAGAVTGAAPPLGAAPTLLLPTDGEPFSINSERIHQLFEDRTQVMWLCASAGGLNKVDLHQKPFGQLRRQLSGQATRPNNYINAVYKEEATNTLWLGTRNGVTAYDLAHKTYRSYLNQDQAGAARGVDVSAICQLRDGALWFGTRGRGLVRLVRRAGREQLTTFDLLPNGRRLSSASIERLAEDRYGTLWVATFDQGLLRLSAEGKFMGAYGLANGLLSKTFTFLLFDPQRDVLWASTRDAGLLKLRVTPDSLRLLRLRACASTTCGRCCSTARARSGLAPSAAACTSSAPTPGAAKRCAPSTNTCPKATPKACWPTRRATSGLAAPASTASRPALAATCATTWPTACKATPSKSGPPPAGPMAPSILAGSTASATSSPRPSSPTPTRRWCSLRACALPTSRWPWAKRLGAACCWLSRCRKCRRSPSSLGKTTFQWSLWA
jgi:ligand-binding sensor domain-containing protein